MVDRIESRRVLVPATFAAGTITFTDLDFPPGIVRVVSIIVPRGVRNVVGVGLGYGGSIVIPNTNGELIYTDDEILTWPVDGLPVGVQWQLVTDPQAWFDHFITVRMAVDEIAPRADEAPLVTPVEPVTLAPAAPADVAVPVEIPDTLDTTTAPTDTTPEA